MPPATFPRSHIAAALRTVSFAAIILSLFLVVLPGALAITVSEGTDFPNSTAGGPYTLDEGTNTFSGTISTPNDGQDRFDVIVPAGFQIKTATKTFAAGGNPAIQSANISFAGEDLSGTGSGTFTQGYPRAAGTYSAIVSAGLSVGNAWSITITVETIPDYVISSNATSLTITDQTGNDDTLTISQPGSGQIQFSATGRTFSINGGAKLSDSSGSLTLPSGASASITISTGAGADSISIGAFASAINADLTINGGTGDDTVMFTGALSLGSDHSLDVDLQDDAEIPGADSIQQTSGASVTAHGSGSIVMRCNRTISIGSGCVLTTENGSLRLEANRQSTPTSGSFVGARFDNCTVGSTGTGPVVVSGTGGDDASGSQLGVEIVNGAHIQTSSGDIEVEGTGGASTGQINRGVTVYGAGSAIHSDLGMITITATGGPVGSYFDIGLSLLFGGEVSNGSGSTMGTPKGISITATGSGAPSSGFAQGVEVSEPGSRIYSEGGDMTIHATAGPGGDSQGVHIANSGSIATSTAGGDVAITTDHLSIDNTGTITMGGAAGILAIYPPDGGAVDLGGPEADGVLGLTDAELNRVTANELVIGNTTDSTITISSPISPANVANLSLNSSAGSVSLSSVVASATGADVSLAGAGNVSLVGNLTVAVTGPDADSGFPQLQLNTAGTLTLANAHIDLTGTTLAGTVGETFEIVNVGGTEPIDGTFVTGTGAPITEGTFIPWPGDDTLAARISYVGGDGNDVVLTLAPMSEALDVSSTADDGPGSLRAAVTFAALHTGPDTINFAAPLSAQQISLTSGAITLDGNLTIYAGDLPFPPAISASQLSRIFEISSPDAVITLDGLTLQDGSTPSSDEGGGAILSYGSVELVGCTVTGNTAPHTVGGAIAVASGGGLIVQDCTFATNSSLGGGAIFLESGSATIERSTFYDNSGAFGGVIAMFDSQATLTHCTLTDNHATGSDPFFFGGGAIDSYGPSPDLVLDACIIAGNTSAAGRAPEVWHESGLVTAAECLIGNGADSDIAATPGNFVGTSESPVDPLVLGPNNFGGPTKTFALTRGSPARDAAPAFPITSDQRGKPQVGIADIGAYETGSPAGFYEWALEEGRLDAQPSDDSDGDGLSDGIEYAANTDPLAPTPATAPLDFTLSPDGATATLHVPYRIGAADLVYEIEESFDLNGDWTVIAGYEGLTGFFHTFGSELSVSEDPPAVMTISVPTGAHPRVFYRLVVEALPPP